MKQVRDTMAAVLDEVTLSDLIKELSLVAAAGSTYEI
jgi:DNA-binding IscR family transcriptional regulator